MNKTELDRSQRKALGKGLSALLPGRPLPGAKAEPTTSSAGAAPAASAVTPKLPENFEQFQSIEIDNIQPGSQQPRGAFDSERLEELAQSIRANGLIQPITVCKDNGKFSILAGERRWRAAKLAGLTTIPALVRTVEQNRRLELALIENIQREDLNPIETATAFQRLVEQHKLSHEQLAERTGKDRSTITNFLRLLKLPAEVQSDLATGDISMGHARALLGLPSVTLQRQACQQILDKRLSVRETERLVKDLAGPKSDNSPGSNGAGKKAGKGADANIRAAITELQNALGTKVRLVPRANGSGKLEIEYYSQDDLDRIYAVIVGSD